jgi:hypothetical protein
LLFPNSYIILFWEFYYIQVLFLPSTLLGQIKYLSEDGVLITKKYTKCILLYVTKIVLLFTY